MERQRDPEIFEAVARVVDPADGEALPLEDENLAEPLSGVVACQHCPAPPAQDHEPAVGELVRVEPEDEPAVRDEQLHLGHLGHGRIGGDARGERLGQERAREVRHVRLEQPEVGAAHVHEVGGGAMHAVRDREQRHDQGHAETDSGHGERRARGAPEEVAPDECGPGDRGILVPSHDDGAEPRRNPEGPRGGHRP